MAFLVLWVAMSDRKYHFEGLSFPQGPQGPSFFFLDEGGGGSHLGFQDVSYITEWLNFKDFFWGDGHPQVEKVSADFFLLGSTQQERYRDFRTKHHWL